METEDIGVELGEEVWKPDGSPACILGEGAGEEDRITGGPIPCLVGVC